MPPANDIYPLLHSVTALACEERIYDVKFYPYGTIDDEHIFAVVSATHVIVYRTNLGSDPPFEILRCLREDHVPQADSNCLVWTIDSVTKKPILCTSGFVPKLIKLFDVETGELTRTLAGHGGGINDLAISPLSTDILASGAEDNTIRLWNLTPEFTAQPCVAIFAGEGHKAPVLAANFHHNGRWLLSGGIDTAICLWAVPELIDLEKKRNSDTRHEPMIVYYPHFYTKELHPNFVDSLSFYGDLVISRSARNQTNVGKEAPNNILIWKIDGFNPDDPPPAEPPIPLPAQWSRSSFPHSSGLLPFQRLLTLDMPHTDRFYHRFGLLHTPGMTPILAMGNQKSQYCWWDLHKLEQCGRSREQASQGRKAKATRGGKSAINPVSEAHRSESVPDRDSEQSRNPTTPPVSQRSLRFPQVAQAPSGPAPYDRFEPIEPHFKKKVTGRFEFGTSQIAWSPDGTWMVGVGDRGVMCMFYRSPDVVGLAGQSDQDDDG